MKDELILEDFLPYRLSITSHTVSTNIARVYEKRFGVSIPEWRVIAVLGRYPGLSAVEVNGRIDRQFADADRRRSILNLSEEGQKVHNEIAPLALEFERQLVQDISEQDYEIFNSTLEQLLDKARQLGS
jgi:DNA-binding MarR family transcriptional regulator